MSVYRDSCKIGQFVRFYKSMKPHYSSVKIYALYLDHRNSESVKDKALALYSMKLGWHKLMNIEM